MDLPLSNQQLAALACAAVLMFWAVGAYNRLMALRNGVGQAWAKVDEALRQRSAAAEPLLAALREPLAGEAGALDKLQLALAEAAQAATAMGARPMLPTHAAAWVAAESALGAAASRVFALLDHNAGLRMNAAVTEPAAAWRDASTRLAFSRQLFNEAAEPYDEAIALFPTSLLVGMFRFDKAGRI